MKYENIAHDPVLSADLLIVPEGIEIRDLYMLSWALSILLIVPEGIEMTMDDITVIEIDKPFNRTRRN